MAVLTTMVLFARPQHLLLPNLEHDALIGFRNEGTLDQLAENVLCDDTLTLILVVEDFFAL